jgi:hypothetical protein
MGSGEAGESLTQRIAGVKQRFTEETKFSMMSEEAKKRIQLALAVAIVVVGARVGYVLYERHEDYVAAQKQVAANNAGYTNQEYYVSPKKLYPFDLKAAMQLTEQPVWAKEGYRYTYYPYDAGSRKVELGREAGLLLPIEKLQIKDVVTGATGGKRQVMAVFEKDGKNFAVPIGFESDGQYKIYSDEMFYVEDPHELYKFWPADVWQAIEQHEVKPGMDELQADFAVGMGVPDPGATSADKTVRYANGGKAVVVEYRGGRAAEVKAGS